MNGDESVDAVDVQLVVNAVLGIAADPASDIDISGTTDAVDVQLVVNAVLGIPIGALVPDVVRLAQGEAQLALVAAGLTVGNVTQTFSATVPAEEVVSQEPAAGERVWPGTAVNLEVSKGPGADETLMLPGGVPLELLWIPGGTFLMGRYAGELESNDWEGPQHEVTLTHGFVLSKYELTKRQWTAVMGTVPWSDYPDVLDDQDSPAVYVSWDDAQQFILTINTLSGETFRLPTEAAWEYACRSGTTTRFYWGDDPGYTAINAYAWNLGNAIVGERSRVVGLKLPNAWGFYDLSGNVWEWCQDRYGSYPSEPVTDPAGPDTGPDRVLRGGSWGFFDYGCRSAYRYHFDTAFKDRYVGLRLAK